MQGYCDIFLTIILKGTLTEEHVYMRHQGMKFEHCDVRDMIYHKFLHSTASYLLNRENVNVVLEYIFIHTKILLCKNKFSSPYPSNSAAASSSGVKASSTY